MVEIKLHNTATRSKEVFTPIDRDNVRMYVCGPTVYDRAHLGNARPVVVFDVLYRLLRHVAKENGWGKVTYVRNFTDVDDKIIARANESGVPIDEITSSTTQWYLDDMAALGALEPDQMPRATQHIGDMIKMIEELMRPDPKGVRHAYEKQRHVLFSVDSYADYGKLSGRSVDDMIAGARVEVAPYKRNPMDFVLWKPAADDEPGWDSPWGRGRPGWHIECSAMSYEILGESFDIHGGGNDLMFPHHENEIAQSKCAHSGAGFANYWLHNEMLQVEGKKMSKSLGNFFTVHDLLKQGVPGEVIRFVFLGTHYRKPMDWTERKREEYEVELRRWHKAVKDAPVGNKLYQPVLDELADDLNTWGAITMLRRLVLAIEKAETGDFRHVHDSLGQMREISKWSDEEALQEAKGTLLASAQLMGLLLPEHGAWAEDVDLTALADKLAGLRTAAMETKDFSQVDALKAALLEAGVEVRMSKEGVDLAPGKGFDASKLEGLE